MSDQNGEVIDAGHVCSDSQELWFVVPLALGQNSGQTGRCRFVVNRANTKYGHGFGDTHITGQKL